MSTSAAALSQVEARIAARLDQHYTAASQMVSALGSAQAAQIKGLGEQVDEFRREAAVDRADVKSALSKAAKSLEIATEANERSVRAESIAIDAHEDAKKARSSANAALQLSTANSARIDKLPMLMVWTGMLGVLIGGGLVSLAVVIL